MKSMLVSKAIALAIIVTLSGAARGRAAESPSDAAELIRSMYKTDRQAFLTEEMRLTERESSSFWPIYRAYRGDMDKLGDRLLNAVLEYRDVYPNVSNEQATTLLRELAEVEENIAQTRWRYMKRAAKDVSPQKALRWAQLENRMDLGLRLQLASAIPLAPDAQLKR